MDEATRDYYSNHQLKNMIDEVKQEVKEINHKIDSGFDKLTEKIETKFSEIEKKQIKYEVAVGLIKWFIVLIIIPSLGWIIIDYFNTKQEFPKLIQEAIDRNNNKYINTN